MLVKKTMYYMVDPDSSREEALLKGNVSANCNVGLPTAGEGDKTTMRPFAKLLWIWTLSLFVFRFVHYFHVFGSVRQIKLATYQLLGAR